MTRPPIDPTLQAFFRSVRREEQATATTGYLNENNELIDPSTGLDAPYIWVLFTDNRSSTRAICSIPLNRTVPSVPVLLERTQGGEWEVKRIDGSRAPYGLGTATQNAMQSVVAAEVNRQLAYGRNIVDGRVLVSVTGGLKIAITAFDHSQGTFPFTDEIVLTPTATAGAKAFTVVSVNPETNDVTLTLGDDLPGTFTFAYYNDIAAAKQFAAAVDTPTGDIRLAAVLLANGATSVATTDILDIREWLGGGNDPLRFRDATELTIASGVITPTQTTHTVDTESDAASDDLDTITAPSPEREQWLSLRPANGARTVNIRHNGGGTGNIRTADGNTVVLDEAYKTAILIYLPESDVWWVAAPSANGSSSSSLPNFGSGVIKTLSSDVASAGTDRHLILAAQSGTADDLIEITGLNVGDEVIIRADSGDTITVVHNDAGATDKIILYNTTDLEITGDETLKLVKTASGKVVQYVDEKGSSTGSGTGAPDIILRDEQTANTKGGTFTSGAWQTRVLNTEVRDANNNCSLSSNAFTLDAGTYYFEGNAPAWNCGRHKLRLQNTSDASTTVVGESAYSSVGRDMQTLATISGVFTIASSKTFELQHRCDTTANTTGFGVASNFSVIEVYAVMRLWKIA